MSAGELSPQESWKLCQHLPKCAWGGTTSPTFWSPLKSEMKLSKPKLNTTVGFGHLPCECTGNNLALRNWKKKPKQAPKKPNQQQQNPRTCRVYLHIIAKRCMNPGVLQTLCSNDIAMTLEEMLSMQAKATRYRITCRIQHGKDTPVLPTASLFCMIVWEQHFSEISWPSHSGSTSIPTSKGCGPGFFSLCAGGKKPCISVKAYGSKCAQMNVRSNKNVKNNSFFQTANFNCHLNQCNNQYNMEDLGPSSSKHLNMC